MSGYLKKIVPEEIVYIRAMEINIQNAKIEMIQWLTTLEDSALIHKLLELRKAESKDWGDEISEEERKSIEQGVLDAENGKVKPHSEVRKIYEKWL